MSEITVGQEFNIGTQGHINVKSVREMNRLGKQLLEILESRSESIFYLNATEIDASKAIDGIIAHTYFFKGTTMSVEYDLNTTPYIEVSSSIIRDITKIGNVNVEERQVLAKELNIFIESLEEKDDVIVKFKDVTLNVNKGVGDEIVGVGVINPSMCEYSPFGSYMDQLIENIVFTNKLINNSKSLDKLINEMTRTVNHLSQKRNELSVDSPSINRLGTFNGIEENNNGGYDIFHSPHYRVLYAISTDDRKPLSVHREDTNSGSMYLLLWDTLRQRNESI